MKACNVCSRSVPVLIIVLSVFLSMIRLVSSTLRNFGDESVVVYSTTTTWDGVDEAMEKGGSGGKGDNNEMCSEGGLCSQDSTIVAEEDDDVETTMDPMLVPMWTPMDPDFGAYVRADVSSFYREPLGSRVEQPPRFNGFPGKFVNISPYNVRLYWEDGKGSGLSISDIKAWEAAVVASVFPGHTFFFVNADDPGHEILCDFEVVAGNSIYYFDPFIRSAADDGFARMQPWSRGKTTTHYNEQPPEATTTTTLSLTALTPSERDSYETQRSNLEFGAHYKDFTGGSEWLSVYPRSPPKHKMWRADYFGQRHSIQTGETHFTTLPRQEILDAHEYSGTENSAAIDLMRFFRDPGVTNLTIEAISCAPRVFEIRNFLSDVEINHILDLVETKRGATQGSTNLRKSRVARPTSSKNTNTTVVLPRYTSPIIDAVYRRAADVLRIDEAMLRTRTENEVVKGYEGENGDNNHHHQQKINEDMQIVRYYHNEKGSGGDDDTQHNDDFGRSLKKGDGSISGAANNNNPSRSIHLCVYLNDSNGDGGGEASFSFPRWRNGETGEAIRVAPEKGKAVVVYLLQPDGNIDDLALHHAPPATTTRSSSDSGGNSETWIANLWIWDPLFPGPSQ